MADEHRIALSEFVAGNIPPPKFIRDAASEKIIISDDKLTELQDRLHRLQEVPGEMPEPTDDPGAFASAIRAREQEARKRDDEGQPIPRWHADRPIIKQVYQAHDAIIQLPHPGGLGAALLVLLVFFVILIPATGAGETRGLLLWDVLLGRKRLQNSDTPLVAADGGVQNQAASKAAAIAGAISAGIGIGIQSATGLSYQEELGLPAHPAGGIV